MGGTGNQGNFGSRYQNGGPEGQLAESDIITDRNTGNR
jgi:hypothetical protein